VTDDSDNEEEEEAPPLLVPKDEDDSDSDSDDDDNGADEDKYPETLSGALKYLKDYTIPDSYTDSDDEDATETPPPSPPRGKGLRLKVKPSVYNPTTGKAYPQDLGVVHLSYRGNRYKLKEGVIYFNIGDRPASVKGVVNLNLEQDPAPSEMTDDDIAEHVIGLVLLNQHNLKKGLKLFGLHRNQIAGHIHMTIAYDHRYIQNHPFEFDKPTT